MKNKYSLNSKNQLLIKPPKQKKPITARGRFGVDKNNELVYWLNEPSAWRRLYNLPAKISFKGNWKLNSNYDLELGLQESKNQHRDERLVFKGEVISTDRDTLVFEMISRDSRGESHIQLLKLSGSWQADGFNRIIFSVKKKSSPDIITLEGAWQINKNQQVTYAYEKAELKRKTRISRVLAFEGFWEINDSNKLSYILSHSEKSRFDFRVQIGSRNLYPAEGVIKYLIGIGVKENKAPWIKIICLYGKWKLGRRAGLVFSMEYAKGEVRDIEFGASVYLNKRNELVFSLADKKGEPFGLNIIFNHKFLQKLDAQAFLKIKDIFNNNEAAVEAGVNIPF
jgi:hypothetical protein